MRTLKYRVHEWMADHIASVQYPPPLPAQDVEETDKIRLDQRVRRVFWTLAAIWVFGSIAGGAISALFEPAHAPVPASQPGGDAQGKPRLHVLGTSDGRWA